jgi:serine/threonine-protein kinase
VASREELAGSCASTALDSSPAEAKRWSGSIWSAWVTMSAGAGRTQGARSREAEERDLRLERHNPVDERLHFFAFEQLNRDAGIAQLCIRARIEDLDSRRRRKAWLARPDDGRVRWTPRHMEPQIIDGKYQILRKLGQGGMGAVYEAKNLETGRHVAVKVIISELIAQGSDAIVRFKREAKAAGAVDMRHVAQILDAGRDATTGDPYMVMELLSGEDLKQLIRRIGPIAPEVALRITAQACLGLQAAHEAGIIHRDIKSANLYLARRESGEVVVKIVDFGVAKIMAEQASGGDTTDLTRTGAVLGSPRYMSPEQAKGEGGIGPWSDLWSLGVVLYEMLTGKTPHADVEGTFGLVMAICTIPAAPVIEGAPWVSPECAAIVHKALQIDTKNRFASATEMLSAISASLAEGTSIQGSMLVTLSEEVKTTSSVSPRSVRGGGETVLNLTHGTSGTRVVPSRRSVLGPALALSLLLGAGGLAAYKLRGSNPTVEVAVKAEVTAAIPATAAEAPSVAPAPASAEQTVRLSVEPADATVEIDGRATLVKDGNVDIVGALGSVHHVRVMKGAREASANVAISALGAVPAQVKVSAPAAKGPLKPYAGGVDAGRTPTVATTAAPVTKPKPAAPATKFE